LQPRCEAGYLLVFVSDSPTWNVLFVTSRLLSSQAVVKSVSLNCPPFFSLTSPIHYKFRCSCFLDSISSLVRDCRRPETVFTFFKLFTLLDFLLPPGIAPLFSIGSRAFFVFITPLLVKPFFFSSRPLIPGEWLIPHVLQRTG